MSLKISELRQFLRELHEKEASLKVQIEHTEGLIASMSSLSSRAATRGENAIDDVPFKDEVASFFSANNNTPTKRAHILKPIMAKYSIAQDKARNKFTLLYRDGFVIKSPIDPRLYILAKTEQEENPQ